MKLCNEFLKTLTWMLAIFALGGIISNQMRIMFSLIDENTTRTGWTVLEDRATYDWCHAFIGSRSDVIEDGMVETKNFGRVYIYKKRR